MYIGALNKARSIDTMWRSGQPVQLLVDNLTPRWVLITAFKIKYRNEYEIRYEITLERVSSDDLNEILYGESASSSNSGQSTVMSGSPQQTYTVQEGDTLWKIASRQYGDGLQYSKIASANNIKDPSSIQSGQQLVIPT